MSYSYPGAPGYQPAAGLPGQPIHGGGGYPGSGYPPPPGFMAPSADIAYTASASSGLPGPPTQGEAGYVGSAYPPAAGPGYLPTGGFGFSPGGQEPGFGAQPSAPPFEQGYPAAAMGTASSTAPTAGYPYQSGYGTQPPTAGQGYPSAGPGYPPQGQGGVIGVSPGIAMTGPTGGYLAPQTQSNYGTSAPPYALYPENVSSAPSGGINPPQQGTVRPYPNFNASQDAEALRKAMKGFGSDKTAIIRIMCNRSCAQRVEIVNIYKQMHGRDLIKDLKYELTGRLEDVIVGLCYSVPEYLARELNWAIAGLGTNEECLIEVLCTRSNAEIHAIKRCYQQIFNKDLERDIIGDTSSNFRRILVSLCNGSREEDMVPDACRARNDAHLLRQAGVDRWGTDVSTFNRIMATQSYEQLRLVFREYNALTNHTIAEAITREMSGDLKQAFLAVVKSVLNIHFYYAEKLYKSMKGIGTSDRVLIRIIVSRCEVDMVQIKEEYRKNFKMTLEAAIQSDTSGHYRSALLALVQGNWNEA